MIPPSQKAVIWASPFCISNRQVYWDTTTMITHRFRPITEQFGRQLHLLTTRIASCLLAIGTQLSIIEELSRLPQHGPSFMASIGGIMALTLLASSLKGQTTTEKIIPQIADGAAWQTTIVLANTNNASATVHLTFYREAANGATSTAWPLQLKDGVDYRSMQLRPGTSLSLRTPGVATGLSVGWSRMTADIGVEAYAIFRQLVPGRQDQEGTAAATIAARRIFIPFDNTNGNITSMALVNPSDSTAVYSVTLRTTSGATLTDSVSLAGGGHVAFSTTSRFAGTAGTRGVAEFASDSSALSALALRFNNTGAFSTMPAFAPSDRSGLTTRIIPQVADGEAWSTTLVLLNTNRTGPAKASLSFFREGAGNISTTWPITMKNGSSFQNIQLPPGGSTFLETSGTASSLTTGWAKLDAEAGIEGFAIFKQRVAGRQDQEGTALADSLTSNVYVPFDNADGNVTGLAIVNAGGAQPIPVWFRDSLGLFATDSISLPLNGHAAFASTEKFPRITGLSGLAQFDGGANPLSVIALRFNSSGAFTSLPAFAPLVSDQLGPATPRITSLSPILPQKTQSITIRGSGFGSQPRYAGNSAYLQFTNTSRNWNAGYSPQGNAVGLDVSLWTDSQIVIEGFTGPYGQNGWILGPGDQVQVKVWNAQTATGPATSVLTVGANPGGAGGTVYMARALACD